MRKMISLTIIALMVATIPSLGFAQDTASLYKQKCASCHGQSGERPAMKGSSAIKGMPAEKIEKMLIGYKDETYGGKRKKMMTRIAKKLTPEEIKDLSKLISGF